MITKFQKYFLPFTFALLLISCSIDGLNITENKQMKLVQRGSMIISGSEGDVELQLGDITGGRVDVKMYGIDNDKVYYQSTMMEGGADVFEYAGKKYRIKINHFEEHTFHDDFAFIEFRKVKE